MAKAGPSTDIKKVTPTSNSLALPEYLRNEKVEGIAVLKQYVIIPRLKIIQKTADPKFREKFSTGSVCVVPTLDQVVLNVVDARGNPAAQGPTFEFVPLFFFPSWATLNDFKLKGSEPTFLDFTLDENHPLVQKCRNRALREENHPTQAGMKVRNIEMLNFVVLLRGVEAVAADQPVVMTFAKGEYMKGHDFAAAIKKSQASIYARRWLARPTHRPGTGKGDWYGFDVYPPEGNPFVSQEEYTQLKGVYGELSDQHMKKGFKPDTSDEELGGEPAETPGGGDTQY
jgi:hypothetical protein